MPKQTKICRVCGKKYEACRSIKTGDSVFNWREVACSPECGKIYLQQVIASRSARNESEEKARVSRKKKTAEHVNEDAAQVLFPTPEATGDITEE